MNINRVLVKFCSKRAAFLLDKITKIAGSGKETICMALVARELNTEGYSKCKISQALGKDRSTIHWYIKEAERVLDNPRDHEDIMYVYRRFKERKNDVYYRSIKRAVSLGDGF